MKGTKCPLCGKTYNELLGHLVIAHKIDSIDHLKEKIQEEERHEKRKTEFRKYVEELHKKLRKGEISGKDFGELTVKWEKEHP